MFRASFFSQKQELKILCLGAHPDDIEIGCGGTVLRIIEEVPHALFYWAVFSGSEKRVKEAREAAKVFLDDVKSRKIIIHRFRESYFPFVGASIKDCFEKLKREFYPDIVFTHYRNDAHQDHCLISSLTWNTFRNSLIIEYEIPKYDGDLATPNLYVHLNESQVRKKIDSILGNFTSQKEKPWFTEETLRSILRIRGIESNAPSNYSEAFHCRKIVV